MRTLTLILGRAGTGKTSWVMDDFAGRMQKGQKNLYYIVPEQYSHDAERQLLRRCGDTLSLYGEVLSFTRLTRRVLSETGGLAASSVDAGGRLLLMSRAVMGVASRLTVYGAARRKAEFLEKLVETVREFKRSCVTPDDLVAAAGNAASPLREKLLDLALIAGAYDAGFGEDKFDPDDLLGELAGAVKNSTLFDGGCLYIDGFSDFTIQELKVVEELIKTGAEMAVCLSCDGLSGTEEIFNAPRSTAATLLRLAAENGVGVKLVNRTERTAGRPPELDFLERNLFLYQTEKYGGVPEALELYRAVSPGVECEYAAARVLALVHAGYRWRDITVAAADWSEYGGLLENTFEKYGIPYYVSKKTDIRQKPPVALIENALEIVSNGWDCESVFRYLKTGLTGIPVDGVDELENYVLTWNIRGTMWTRDADWLMTPGGYDGKSDGDEKTLKHLNELRKAVAGPVKSLQDALEASSVFGDKLRALYNFLEGIGLPERIREKRVGFLRSGQLQTADEYDKLWDVLVRAMDQFYEAVGAFTGTTAEFARLWSLLVTQYDIGSIPVSLDRVGLGDMARQRRRDVRCLILVGASDDLLPRTSGGGGILSDSERKEAVRLGVTLGATAEERLGREMNGIYSLLTLPSDRLFVSWPESGFGGEEKRPSFVVRRLKELFALKESADTAEDFRLCAVKPLFELAASGSGTCPSKNADVARSYLSRLPEEVKRLKHLKETAVLERGALSKARARALYGRELVMSASRVDKFSACRYLYFMQYGLNLKPRKPAGFDAPVAGTFMHYILENVTRDIRDEGGFHTVTEAHCRELTAKYVDGYISETLDGFRDRTSRFRYLFNRLKKDVNFIVLDMVRELKNSDFAPVDFELEFSDTGDVAPLQMSDGELSVKIKGFVDRVDGWVRDGKLYLRVVDYKTGRKVFKLSDVWYGMNMQMLIYLFALCEGGRDRYGLEIVPAGVLYAPARDELLPASRHTQDSEVEDARLKKLRRSGLILNDGGVVGAMAYGDGLKYIPLKLGKDGAVTGDALAGLEQLGRLSQHIGRTLLTIAENIAGGSIKAEPFYKNGQENACNICDYRTACHFSEKDGDTRRYLRSMDTAEAWKRIEGGNAL